MKLQPARNAIHIVISAFALAVSGCGITSAKYIDYKDGDEGTTEDPCETSALELFNANIQPTIEQTCSGVVGCHETGVPQMPLKKGAALANMKAMFAFMDGDAEKVTKQISLQLGTHTGGKLDTELPQSQIEPWFTKFSECAQ
jgi:hypothetical protein